MVGSKNEFNEKKKGKTATSMNHLLLLDSKLLFLLLRRLLRIIFALIYFYGNLVKQSG